MDAGLHSNEKKTSDNVIYKKDKVVDSAVSSDIPRVLLVNDSKTIRQTTEAILTQYGCKTTTATDGFDALCKIAAVDPHLVLMDALMPRLDGFQTCALIRHSEKYSKLPVVLVSSNDGLLEKTKAGLVGAQRYIVKPFRREDILRALCDFVSQAILQNTEQSASDGAEQKEAV